MNSKCKHNMFLKLYKYIESIKCDKNISVKKNILEILSSFPYSQCSQYLWCLLNNRSEICNERFPNSLKWDYFLDNIHKNAMWKNSTSPSVNEVFLLTQSEVLEQLSISHSVLRFSAVMYNKICEDFHEKVNSNNKFSLETLWSLWVCFFLWHFLRRGRKKWMQFLFF